jgi:predicted pyridoxine 5'-phosphate oxidase superfamily flavin-nucleotide-binding protein
VISNALQAFVNEWRLGYIATMGAEGPNVSPKGTFQALDETRIAFAEIRSPNTMANLAQDARVEVNMVDVFARKGARFRGVAAFHAMETAEAQALCPRWVALFGEDLMARSSGFVVISVTSAKPLSTPAYDVGATEMELRQNYRDRFNAMQDAWLNKEDASHG